MKNNFYKKKEILVTGGTGMIGVHLVQNLKDLGAKVTVASLDNIKPITGVKYIKADLRNLDSCLNVTKNKNIVFHLAGIKGSPLMAKTKPASFFVPTLQFSLNMMEASFRNKIENYLFTSSIGVYSPAKKFKEDSVWKTFPSENDKYAGWAKRICELQSEVYEIQYKWNKISVVRPANVYGPYDNFDEKNAMVIPSLISRALRSRKKLSVWGNGSNIRDFIYADDVARAMIYILKKEINYPVNIGSGKGVSIKEIVEKINKNLSKPLEIEWSTNKILGDKIRVMDNSKLKKIGFTEFTSLETGINQTINWYKKNLSLSKLRYNSFTEKF
jgi:GDP-L-fucose synthase